MFVRALCVSVVLSVASLAMPLAALAQAYSARDAQYVTTSRDPAVLGYVVCLEASVGVQPRNVSIQDALKRAVTKCRPEAARLPKSSSEPNAADLSQMILECGFRPGQGSPDMGCGTADTGAADFLTSTPEIIDVGKWAEGIAYDLDSIWVAESGQRTVSRFDLESGAKLGEFKVGRLPVDVRTSGSGDIYVMVATDKQILRIRGKDKPVSIAKLAECPTQMIEDSNIVWVLAEPDCGSKSSRLLRVDPKTKKQTKTGNLGAWATDLVAFGPEIWVSHAQGEAVSVVNRDTLKFQKLDVPGAELWVLNTNFEHIFAGGRNSGSIDDGLVLMIDPQSFEVLFRTELPGLITAVTSDENFVYAVNGAGLIYVLSAADLSLLRTVDADLGAYQTRAALILDNRLLLSVGMYSGENGALFHFDDIAPAANGAGKASPKAAPGRGSGLPKFGQGTPTGKQGGGFQPTGGKKFGQIAPGGSGGFLPVKKPTGQGAGFPAPGGFKIGQPNGGGNVVPRPIVTSGGSAKFGSPGGNGGPGQGKRQLAPGFGASPGFPVIAASLGGRVRIGTLPNSKLLTATKEGQPVTLLSNVGRTYKGFPWFAVRLGNGLEGFQWGGTICATGRPITGVRGECERNANAVRPRKGGQTNGADVAISIIDLFGKIIDAGSGQPGTIQSPGGKGGTIQFPAGKGGTIQSPAGKGGTIQSPGRKGGTIQSPGGKGGTVRSPGSSAGGTTVQAPAGAPAFGGNDTIVQETITLAAGTGGLSRFRDLRQDQAAIYTVRAKKGQILHVEIFSSSQNAVFEIFVNDVQSGGATLPGAGEGGNATFFEAPLPADANYRILVGSTGGQTSYELVVGLEVPVRQVAGPQTKGGNQGAAGSPSVDIAVGTYQGPNAPSGNIENRSGVLTWTEFCGPTTLLIADFANSRLLTDTAPQQEFKLSMSQGQVTGFTFGPSTYTKAAGIMMPSCVAAPQADPVVSGVPVTNDWMAAPKDPRSSDAYTDVPQAAFDLCVAANADPASPSFNNEKAFNDCAVAARDAAIAAGGQTSVTTTVAQPGAPVDWTLNPTDPRSTDDYTDVPDAAWQACQSANEDAASPSFNNEKLFFDCAVAAKPAPAAGDPNAGGTPVVAGTPADWTLSPTDSRFSDPYAELSDADWQACQSANADPASPSFNNEKLFFDCADAARVAALARDWTLNPTDSRESKDYATVSAADAQICLDANADQTSPAFNDEKAFFDCLDGTEAAAIAAGGTTPATGPVAAPGSWMDNPTDPRSNDQYNDVNQVAIQVCLDSNADTASPAFNNEGIFFTCLDTARAAQVAAGPTPAVGSWMDNPTDPRSNDQYNDVDQVAVQICLDANSDTASPAFNNEGTFFTCLDAARAAQATDGPTVQPDPNAGIDPTDPSADPAGDPAVDPATDPAAVADPANDGKEPGWDRDAVFYQPAYDYCFGTLGLSDTSTEYVDCYFAFPDYPKPADATDPNAGIDPTDPAADPAGVPAVDPAADPAAVADPANDGKEPGWDRDVVFYQPAYDYCFGTLGLSDTSAEYADCYFGFPNYPKAADATDPNAGIDPTDPAADPATGPAAVADPSGDPASDPASDPAAVADPANDGKEPGWDRDVVFYQPAYDYCAGQLGLSDASAEYADCYFGFPDYPEAADPGAAADPVATDPRAGNDYGGLDHSVRDSCRNDNGSDQTTGYYDCLDAAVSQASRAEAQAGDPRRFDDWSDLTDEEKLGCETYGFESSAYFDCFEQVREDKRVQAEQARADADAAAEAAANQSAPDSVQEPGWDRDVVFYQPAYDYCTGAMQLDDTSDEYATCYFAYPNYP